jgi:hypothetical protein
MGNGIQRRHVRFPANHEIRVCAFRGDVRETKPARMVDVSEGGICFVSTRYLAPETKVKIDFEKCVLLGEVKSCHMREYGAQVEFVTGVEITQAIEGAESWNALTRPD